MVKKPHLRSEPDGVLTENSLRNDTEDKIKDQPIFRLGHKYLLISQMSLRATVFKLGAERRRSEIPAG